MLLGMRMRMVVILRMIMLLILGNLSASLPCRPVRMRLGNRMMMRLRMRMVVKLRMIMFFRNLGNCLLPCM